MTSQSEINQTQSLPFLCVLVIQSLMTYELVVFFFQGDQVSFVIHCFETIYFLINLYSELYCNRIQFSYSLKFCSGQLSFVIQCLG